MKPIDADGSWGHACAWAGLAVRHQPLLLQGTGEQFSARLLELVERYEWSGGTGDLVLSPLPQTDLGQLECNLDGYRAAED